MGDNKNGEEESRKSVTTARKLYGSITELSLQIDSLSSRCLEIEDLFSHDLQAKRVTLKDCCESLFNVCPKTYGSLAREKLWRMGLYDAVARARKMQKDRTWTPAQLGLVKTHLQSGIGVLQLYVMKLKGLCSSPNDPLVMRSDVLDICLESNSKGVKSDIITNGERQKSWITELVHICVVNIGDLYRYLREIHLKTVEEELAFESAFYLSGAQTHYMQAFLLRPDSGLAFNQLGNLYADVGGLHSVYYLLYSIQSTSTYEGSYSNLRQLLDRKIVHFARLPASVESRPMDTLVNNILSLMYYFLYEHTQLQNYERHCQEALTNFTERLVTFDPELDEKFLFQLSSVCVMMVWRLQVTNSVHTSAAVGFAISVFCQLVNHLMTILEQHSHVKLCSSESVALSPSPMPSDGDQISVTSASRNREVETDEFEAKHSSQEDGDKNDFTAPKRRKRRRRGRGISDSESEGSDYGTPDFIYTDEEELENSEESEDDWEKNSDDEEMDFNGSIPDEDCEKISHKDENEYGYKFKSSSRAFDSSSSNGNSDASVSGVQANEPNGTEKHPKVEINGLDNPIEIGAAKTENDKQKFMIPVEDLMKCRSQVEASLVALSPFLRWIQASPVVKDALAANVEKTFLEKLCSTLNLLISQNWPSLLDDVSICEELKGDWKTLSEETVNEKSVFKWELEEDRSALGIPHFQDFLKDLKIQSLTPNDTLVIRIGRMVAFGSWLVSTENFSILYSAEELNYFVPNPQTLKAYLLQSKLKRLKARLGNGTSDELDKLTKAYKDMKISSKEMEKASRRNRGRRDDDDDREPRRNRRRRGGTGRRLGGSSTSDPVYAVIDLEAIIKKFYDVKRVAANRKFIIVIPHSAWKTLDMLKDSDEEDAKNARIAFRWLEGAIKRKHPGLILQKDQQKMEINFPYPKDPIDVDAWDYFDMMECCNYITNTWLKNKPRSNEVIWGDVRDKCRVFFLTGREDLLNTRIPRSFDPVKIARNVGIFVDFIVPYPGLGRGKKWKSVAKTNG